MVWETLRHAGIVNYSNYVVTKYRSSKYYDIMLNNTLAKGWQIILTLRTFFFVFRACH